MGSFTDDQGLYFIYFVLFTSGAAWLTILLGSVTAILPDIVARLLEDITESKKLKDLKADYLRNIYNRNKGLKQKKPKFLKYITLPSFANLASTSSSSSATTPNGSKRFMASESSGTAAGVCGGAGVMSHPVAG